MTKIKIFERVGNRDFAENKDIGQEIRIKEVFPQLKIGEEIILDFERVKKASQSFIHSLISDAIRQHGAKKALKLIVFKNCSDEVREMIGLVVNYMQDALNKNVRNV